MNWLKRLDRQDALVFAGVVSVDVGFGAVYWPLAFLFTGILSLWLGLRASGLVR